MQRQHKNLAYVGLIMGGIFILCGIGLTISPEKIIGMKSDTTTQLLAFILVLYGGLRFYRAYRSLGNEEE